MNPDRFRHFREIRSVLLARFSLPLIESTFLTALIVLVELAAESLFDADTGMRWPHVIGLFLSITAFFLLRQRGLQERFKAGWGLGMKAERRKKLSTLDELTRLPNRYELENHLSQMAALSQRLNKVMPVIVIDVERLREINLAMGMSAGDQTLLAVAKRLQKALRASDVFARVAGDQFAVITLSNDTDQIMFLLNKLNQLFNLPLQLQGMDIDIDVSFGVAIYPTQCAQTDRLINSAYEALYRAREQGEPCGFFDTAFARFGQARLQLFGDLKRAIGTRELDLYYQPQFEMQSGKICSAEALVRWKDNKTGVVRSPAEFVSMAERTHLLRPFTEMVLEKAIHQLSIWKQWPDFSIAVNLSAGILLDRSFAAFLQGKLTLYGVQASRLTLEVTESMLMLQPERCRQTLCDLKALGCELSLDDFGTGYTSLAYLQSLPVEELKIDRSFVVRLEDRKTVSILRKVIELSHEIKVRTVAEGVETPEQKELLASWGCCLGQGFLVSPAIPAAEFQARFL